MPTDFMSFDTIIIKSDPRVYEQYIAHKWENNKKIILENYKQGSFDIHYYRYPTVIAHDADDSIALDVEDKAFDLVLASMSPAINNLSTLRKMIYCSRQWCYLSGFSGAKQFHLFDFIWNKILARPYREHFNDIIFPYNMIYSLGYLPEITFKTSTNIRKDQITYLEQQLLSDLSREINLTQEIIDSVRALLMENSYQGIVEHKVTSTIGMIIWKVN
jgi:hypothetical protein